MYKLILQNLFFIFIFKEIPSSASEMSPSESQTKQTRVPKRILHFSDGTLEEFSSDEDDDIEPSCKKRTASIINAINPVSTGPVLLQLSVLLSCMIHSRNVLIFCIY